MTISFTVGICAYNEGGNIEKCIRSVYSQSFDGPVMDEVIVVSSASTDDTDAIVTELCKEFGSLRLIAQERREGKNSAINCILDNKRNDIVVIVNGDNILASEHTLQKMVEPFLDGTVGITGGHPLVMNSERGLANFASNFIWLLLRALAYGIFQKD